MGSIVTFGVTFILLLTIYGTFPLDFVSDPKFENDWTGACTDGRLQSPIAIPNGCGRTFLKYMNIEFTNLHVPIKGVKVTNAARQTIFEWNRIYSEPQRSVVLKTSRDVKPFQPDTPYILQNVHVHHSMNDESGTLHAVNGSLYAMEMHFLFVLPKFDFNITSAFGSLGNVLEIVVLWKLSNVNHKAWTKLNNLMLNKNLIEGEEITSDLSVRLTDFIPRSSTFSLYHGSLPGSRCLEVITWIVFDEVMEFNTEDLGMRRWTYISDGKEVPLKRNTRRIQSLNDRPVYQGRKQRVSYQEQKCNKEEKKQSSEHGYS